MKESLCPNCGQYKYGNGQKIKVISFGATMLILGALISSIEWFYASSGLIKFNYLDPLCWGAIGFVFCILLSSGVKNSCENCHYTEPANTKVK